MTFHCEWQALHGARCSHQCDDCKDEDGATVSGRADHPPALAPIGVHRPLRVIVQNTGTAAVAYHGSAETGAWTWWVPLDLAPEQPARCGGTET